MISPLSLKLYTFSAHCAYFLRAIPFYWDPKAKKLRIVSSAWDVMTNLIFTITLWVYQIFMIVRYIQLIYVPNEPSRSYVVQGILTLTIIMYSVILWICAGKQHLIVGFANQFLRFFMQAQRQYVRKSIRRHQARLSYLDVHITAIEAIGLLLCVGMVFVPWFVMGFYFAHPNEYVFFPSVWPPEYHTIWYLLPNGLCAYWMILSYWCVITFFITAGLILLPNLIFWIGEIKARKPRKAATVDKLRTPGHVLLTYRILQLLTLEFNVLCSNVMILIHTASLIVAVMCNVAVIRFHDQQGVLVQSALISMLIMFIMFLCCSHIMFGKISRLSKAVVRSWMHNTELSPVDSRLMTTYMRSCPVLKFEIGKFGQFQRLGALRNTGRIVVYTVKVLLIS